MYIREINSSSKTGWSINGYLSCPGEDKLWKLECHSGPVSRGNILISTTSLKADVAGDEPSKLRAATACVPLYFTLI